MPSRDHQLNIRVDFETMSFQSDVRISLHVLESTRTIVLHAGANLEGFSTTGTRLRADKGRPLKVARMSRDLAHETLTIEMSKSMRKHVKYTLTLLGVNSLLSDEPMGFRSSGFQEGEDSR